MQASELASAQSFVIELCALLGVAKPHPTPEQSYMFERPVSFAHGDGSTSAGRIDCYRRGHFVLEAKKFKRPAHTRGFDEGMLRARSQAEGYARALPEQARAVADLLAASRVPLSLPAIEARFTGRGPWKKSLPTLLATLEALGRAQAVSAPSGESAWRG